jgi:hypothetical protein
MLLLFCSTGLSCLSTLRLYWPFMRFSVASLGVRL